MYNWKDKISGYEQGFVEIGNIWSINNNLKLLTDDICELINDMEFNTIAAIETKGIILAAPVAAVLSKPLIIFRKKNRISHSNDKYQVTFENWKDEKDGLEIEKKDLAGKKTILVIDDLCERQNSVKAVHKIVQQTDSKISAFVVFINLSNSDEYRGIEIRSLLKSPGM